MSEGLGALASGPAGSQAEPASDRAPIDRAISAFATATAEGRGSAPGGAVPGLPDAGGGDGGAPTGGASPEAGPTAPEAGGGTAGGDSGLTLPEVDTPSSAPVTDAVEELLDGLGAAINGVLGQQP